MCGGVAVFATVEDAGYITSHSTHMTMLIKLIFCISMLGNTVCTVLSGASDMCASLVDLIWHIMIKWMHCLTKAWLG